MNWYKIAIGINDQMAHNIATILTNSLYDVSIDIMGHIHSIIAVIPNEIVLNDSIKKAIEIALRTSNQLALTPEQEEVVKMIYNSFYSTVEAKNKNFIEEDSSQNDIIQQEQTEQNIVTEE